MSIRFDRFGLATTAALAALCLSACGGDPETEVDAAGAAETPASEAGASDGRDEARLAELDETLSDIPEEPADEAEADRLGALMIERMLLRHGDSRDVRRVRPLAMATQTRVAAGQSYTNYVLMFSKDGFYRIEAITPQAHTLFISNNDGSFASAIDVDTGEDVYREELESLRGLHPLCELLAPAYGYAFFNGCYRSPAYLRTETFAGETAHRIRFADRQQGLGEVFLSPDGTPLGDRRLNADGQVTLERRFTSLRTINEATLIETFEVFNGERIVAQSTWSEPRRDAMDEAFFRISPETGRAAIPPHPGDM